MREFLRQLLTSIAQIWRRLSISARVQVVFAAVLTILVVGGAVYIGAQPQYGRLYSRLALDEAGEIHAWLVDNDIPVRIREGGTAIDVPARDIARARVSLAALNLPKSQGRVPGFEPVDAGELMSNRYLQDVNYMRALQRELQRQLNQFDFIRNSFVLIREARDEVAIGEQRSSQATVTLETAGGRLSAQQLKAVLHTVSSFGGANLTEDRIAVMMTDGTILHSPSDDEFASLASDQLEVQVAYEEAAERKIRQILESLKVRNVVKVSAMMDWTSEEVRDRQVTEGALVSTIENSSTVRGVSPLPSGPPGAIANIPEELGRPGEERTISESSEFKEEYEPSEIIRTTTARPGRVKQYRVVAFIEGGYAAEETLEVLAGEAAQPDMTYVPLTPQQIARYTEFIRNAIGEGSLPTDVVVYDQAFDIDRVTPAPVQMPRTPWTDSTWFNWMWRVGLVVLMFLVVRFLMRRALVGPSEVEEFIEVAEPSPSEYRQEEIAAEVERLSQQEPDTVAALLRSWMSKS